ncbi:MAG: aminodeoxychorismate/anthranilate synthase component II, partial [Pseudomonadota bacterium]
MLLLIDNYDSFTYNLYHFLGELGAKVDVRRNDAIGVESILASSYSGIVISPGPCDPDRAGISVDAVRACGRSLPILGVCLGHQSIAQAFGGTISRAPLVMHGKISEIHHSGSGIFKGLPSPFRATRYHSLIATVDSLPPELKSTAHTKEGIIMGLVHKTLPIFGVQFHPESI